MSWAQRQSLSQQRLGRHFAAGGVTVLRRYTLTSARGLPVTDVEVAEGAGAGAEVVKLRAVDGDSYLRGGVPAGLSIELAATTYRLTANSAAANGTVTVQLDPPLAAPVVVGAAVALAGAAEFEVPGAAVYSAGTENLQGILADQASFVVHLPKSGAAITPRTEDVIRAADGRSGSVLTILREDAGVWVLAVGEGCLVNDLGRLFGDLRRVAVPEVRGVVTAAKRGITAALVEEAQEASPSSTGRYRASHRASIGFPSTAKLSGPGPFSAPTPAEISASLARLRSPGPITYVANDTPYAAEVEERHQVYARAIAAVEGRGDEIIDRAVTGGGQ